MCALRCLLGILVAATAAAAQQPAPHGAIIPPGTKLPVALRSTIEAGHAKAGDTFKMTLLAALRGPEKEIAIPRGATLVGRIIESVRRSKTQPESQLSFIVERAEWKGGSVALHAVFDAPGATQPDAEDFSVPGTTTPHPYMVHAPPDGQVIDPSLGAVPMAEVPLDSFEHVEFRRSERQTVLVSHRRNIVLESGTRFTIRQVEAQPN